MIKIWAKVILDDKILKDTIYSNDERYDDDNFLAYLTDICYALDIPTPLILKNHKFNFNNFNIVKFKLTDFVESINFDTLVLENAVEI